MTPGARLAAAIEIIDAIDDSATTAEAVMERYFRTRRYAGSGDRRAIIERVYGCLRRRARLDWWWTEGGKVHGSARGRVLADLALADGLARPDIEALFDGQGYAPRALDTGERARLDALAGHALADPAQPGWVAHEFPAWMEAPLTRLYDGRLADEMDALNGQAPLDLRVNTLRADCARALELLRNDGIAAEATPYSPVGLRLDGRADLARTTAFTGGFVEVQDEGSQIIALMAGAKPGMRVTDFCAGAGGKSLAMAAAMLDEGEITACDVDAKRLAAMGPRLKRARVRAVRAQVLKAGGDPWVNDNERRMDRVLADAPCTGSGRWRRRPEARWRLKPATLRAFAKTQQRILAEAQRLVKPGGRLIYATCSILAEENENQVERLIDFFPAFRVLDAREVWAEIIGGPYPGAPDSPYLRLSPARHGTDGFFVAVLECQA